MSSFSHLLQSGLVKVASCIVPGLLRHIRILAWSVS